MQSTTALGESVRRNLRDGFAGVDGIDEKSLLLDRVPIGKPGDL
jgi:hypothetical protein